MAPAPTIWTFLRAYREHLFALMSGGFSVPFATLAAYLDNVPAKITFAILAIAAVVFAAYGVWRTERAGLIKAEAEIKTLRDTADRRALGLRVLGEIGQLRTRISALRIAMEGPDSAGTNPDEWNHAFMTIDEEIGRKIADLAGPGEAEIYRNRGNMPRHFGDVRPHQLTLDLCIFDLDRLKEFIRFYSGRFVQ